MSSKTVHEINDNEPVAAPGMSWADELRRVSLAVSQSGSRSTSSRNQIYYLLHWTPDASCFGITVHRGRNLEDAEVVWDLERGAAKSQSSVTEQDEEILRLLRYELAGESGLRAYGFAERDGGELLQRLLRTGRFALASDLSPLLPGENRPGRLGWRIDEQGLQRPCFRVLAEGCLAIPLLPPWYVDLDRSVVGLLDVPGDPEILARLFSLPPLGDMQAEVVAAMLAELAPDLPVPEENAQASLRCIDVAPVPVLRLETLETNGHDPWREYASCTDTVGFDVALAGFRYQDAEVGAGDTREFVALVDGETVRVKRRPEAEVALLARLSPCGLEKVPATVLRACGALPENAYGLESEAAWTRFMEESVPALREAGWQIGFDEEFRHHSLRVDAWEADLVASDSGWFNLIWALSSRGSGCLSPRSSPRCFSVTLAGWKRWMCSGSTTTSRSN